MTNLDADAIVVGAGPNGLVGANVLADAGWAVTVLEAEPEPGGGVRSGALVEPGFVNDRFSAFYPLAAASPVFRALELHVRWRHAPLVLAHPAPDGSCAVISLDVDETAASLAAFAAEDGATWRRAMSDWRRVEPGLLRGMTTPFPQLSASARLTLEPAAAWRLARTRFAGEGARRLVAGNALHSDIPPASRLGRAFGLMLSAFAQHNGYPCAEGGAGRITEALVARAQERGVEIRCGARVAEIGEGRVRLEDGETLRAARAVLAAIDVWELGRLTGRPSSVRADPGVVKVDWTLDGPVPWTAEEARRSCVVHVGGPPGSFAIFGQYSMADSSRAPAGKETAWAYTHVDPGAEEAAVVARIEAEVEALAPGFGALVRGRRSELLPPGRVNGGTARLSNQLVCRGRLGRPETGIRGVYLASASAHPGGGVHGAPGWIAARTALRRFAGPAVLRSRRPGGRGGSTA